MEAIKNLPARADWQKLEEFKAKLRKKNLEPKEYEQQVKQKAEELGI